ncbi:hypothetical protein DY000_02021960 [Brassica cretica]|uniref:Uncharacterized protein n=1 Tax=Brassica cretica TaxID=69181 RepID=A0ABQ7E8R2_BRACR|nr:hypothetical protein DY000_02021960 [Brassica cretica]
MFDGRCRSMEDECLRSTVVSECRSTGLVHGSMVVDKNRATNKCCCRSMRSALLCGLNAPTLQDLSSILINEPLGSRFLDHPWNSARPFAELDQVQFGDRPSWIEHGFSSAVRRAGPSPDQRTAEMDRTRIQPRRLPSWTKFSSANGRAGSNADSARPLAELDQSSSANSRAGSTGVRLHLVLVTPLPRLHRTHFCFESIRDLGCNTQSKTLTWPMFRELQEGFGSKLFEDECDE